MFSVAWMTDSEHDKGAETLQEQFTTAKAGTAPVGGNPGSTVMSYGATALLNQPVSSFEGASTRNNNGGRFNLARFLAEGRVTPTTPWVQEQELPGGVIFRANNNSY